jgi:DNA-binding NarL/FixJ family response regulator
MPLNSNPVSVQSHIVRVLIVDDMPHVREELQRLLELTDQLQVIGEAADGQEAIHQVEMLHPDVVLMDVVMPEMDGLLTTRRLKEKFPETRIILLTMYEKYRKDAREAGADAFLIKGCPVDALISAIVDQ